MTRRIQVGTDESAPLLSRGETGRPAAGERIENPSRRGGSRAGHSVARSPACRRRDGPSGRGRPRPSRRPSRRRSRHVPRRLADLGQERRCSRSGARTGRGRSQAARSACARSLRAPPNIPGSSGRTPPARAPRRDLWPGTSTAVGEASHTECAIGLLRYEPKNRWRHSCPMSRHSCRRDSAMRRLRVPGRGQVRRKARQGGRRSRPLRVRYPVGMPLRSRAIPSTAATSRRSPPTPPAEAEPHRPRPRCTGPPGHIRR